NTHTQHTPSTNHTTNNHTNNNTTQKIKKRKKDERKKREKEGECPCSKDGSTLEIKIKIISSIFNKHLL
ncbi:hypothetical protein DRN70_02945, partial [Methanosarcinales archaeon]